MKRLLPAYPLFIKDPFFSFYSSGDVLNANDPVFWTGAAKKMVGLIIVDGKPYSFLGKSSAESLVQDNVEISLFKTIYHFHGADFFLRLEFVSPLPLDDLDVYSSPVCYLNYEFKSEHDHSFSIVLGLHEAWCYNQSEVSPKMIGSSFAFSNYQTAMMGREEQRPFSPAADEVLADWGHFGVAGEEACYVDETSVERIAETGRFDLTCGEGSHYVLAINRDVAGTLYIFRESEPILQYFGDGIRSYYARDGHSVFFAIDKIRNEHDDIEIKLASIDEKYQGLANKVSPSYYEILAASYRQACGANELALDREGNVIFVSKECGSNGCADTVDVSFPTHLLFLLENPLLVEGMLRAVFLMARLKIWTYPFAPHDLGTFPRLNGQVYGLAKREDGSYVISKDHLVCGLEPNENEIYDLSMQMPLEESADMILMAYGLYHYRGHSPFLENNFDLLEGWGRYLSENGESPTNQLCTDDFAGHSEGNVNLSIKSAVALMALSRLGEAMGNTEDSSFFASASLRLKDHIEKVSDACGYLPLSFAEGDKRFSLKYNLALDRLYGFDLFSSSLYEREDKVYASHLERYGIPLDERADYTKSDWEMWVACFAAPELKKEIIASIARFLKEGPDRWPFPDWFDAGDGTAHYFKNRSVQGGLFLPLLLLKKNQL